MITKDLADANSCRPARRFAVALTLALCVSAAAGSASAGAADIRGTAAGPRFTDVTALTDVNRVTISQVPGSGQITFRDAAVVPVALNSCIANPADANEVTCPPGNPAIHPLIRVVAHDGDNEVAVADSVTIPAELYGGDDDDLLVGGSQVNLIDAGDGDDTLAGGGGRDELYGGPGDDTLRSNDTDADRVFCGPGIDQVTSDAADIVDPDCETVTLVPVANPAGPTTTPAGPTATPRAPVVTPFVARPAAPTVSCRRSGARKRVIRCKTLAAGVADGTRIKLRLSRRGRTIASAGGLVRANRNVVVLRPLRRLRAGRYRVSVSIQMPGGERRTTHRSISLR